MAHALERALLDHIDSRAVCPGGDARAYVAAAIAAHTERPERLFREIRWCFPLHRQRRVLALVQVWAAAVDTEIAALRAAGLDPSGNPLRCPVFTRQGRQCERRPLRENGYCPSHQHLAVVPELQTA
ncbi:MAG TPA: hypothetical protein VHF89_09900 [Solirubrobacteraceae bacterium]|nr:hypothetical protein [Solirubrobacteraceae bacterium]